jgi:site-specific recombinase XerD
VLLAGEADLRSGEMRALRWTDVLYRDDGDPFTESVNRELILSAARRVNLRHNGPHMLRHTFCSHLAMRGAQSRL